MNFDERFREIERRLDRLERLVFLGFQDVRDVAEYAYQNTQQESESVKRLTWTRRDFYALSDREAVEVAGLAAHELAALKMTMRTLRRQGRRDVFAVLLNLVRRPREESSDIKEAV